MSAGFAYALGGLHRAWKLARWPIAIGLALALVLIEATIVAVYAWPVDPRDVAPADRDHWVPLTEIPAIAVSAVITSEDAGFWDHRGVDGRGATLSMQLARLIDPPRDRRALGAKLGERVAALRLERALDKRQILEQWMNRAYFGNGAWGIDAAARRYFGKPAHALSDGEAVLLACLPRAPTAYDPIRHLDAARRRRDRVLAMLVARGLLDADAADRAAAQPLAVIYDAGATSS